MVPIPYKLLVGGVAGVVGMATMFPFDLVKTRLMGQKPLSDGTFKYRGPMQAFRTIFAEAGFRGFYAGLPAVMIGVFPEKAIKLGVNESIRDYYVMKRFRETGRRAPPEVREGLVAAVAAAFAQMVATNPMEMVKIRLMMLKELHLPPETALQAVKNLGLKGLYRGTGVTLVRDVPYNVIFFPLYSYLRERWGGETSVLGTFAAGCVAGALAAGTCTPMDVMKTRIQVPGGKERYGGTISCARMIWKEEGPQALLKGLFPRIAVVAPLFGVTLLSFELLNEYIRRQKRQERDGFRAAPSR